MLRALMIVMEISVPALIGVWVWLRVRRPAPIRWLVGATLYVAYAAVAALLAAPLPSGLVLSWTAALVNLAFGGAPATWIGAQPFPSIVGKAWLGIALVPAALLFVAGAGLRRLERVVVRRRLRRAGKAITTPAPTEGAVLRFPPRDDR
jgi:hypothetical protein